MNTRPPVSDWTSDFDHLHPAWIEDPFPIWQELRQTCPVAHTDRFRGVYFPSRYDDVRAIAMDTEHFSSRRIIVREEPPPRGIPAPPITSDPPYHKSAKQVLLPPFTPAAVARHEARTRGICRELIAAFDAKGCDGAVQYAQEIPPRVIAHMLGIREDDGDLFRKWIHEVLELGITDIQVVMRAAGEMQAYFSQEIAKRRDKPTDDLISYLMNAKSDGQPLTDDHVIGSLRLLLIAGIDTTWSAIGSCLWHLARVPKDRERLVNEPQLVDTAVEEFLRAYAPVTMAREVVKETAINGCPMKEGQMVLLSFPAANRDPTIFPDADKVIIDRQQNRHAAFGLGIHRCVGSNLARMEIKVALEEFLKAKPVFRLDASQPMKWSEGTVRGPRRLPILFG